MENIPSLAVAIVGFSALETIKLAKILSLTHVRERRYQALDTGDACHADIILVNADDAGALSRSKYLVAKQTHLKLVLVSAHPDNASGYPFISKPIISSRFAGQLDLIIYPEPMATAPQAAAEPAINLASRDNLPPKRETSLLFPIAIPHKAYRVLIVDDSELVHKALAIELKQALPGSLLDFASSGEEALGHIQENPLYDLIFLDIMMPGIDGYETCKAIRKDGRYKSRIPIIMLSAKSSPLDEVKGVISGCTTYLVKPIVHEQFQTILRRVGAWLGQRGVSAQPAKETIPVPQKRA